LHTACSSSASNGSLDVLNLLLKRGADGNACNKWRETPLLIAANNGHKAAVEALLKSGADPSMCSEAGWSALTFAAHKGYDEIVSLLLNAGAPVNCRVIEDLSTPLHKACAGGKDGHLSAVTQLLTGGADVHALNKWRETPLLTAANHGQASAVEALLDAGADPCRCTDTGWSPLSIAAYKGHDDVVELLLEQGAPTEEADPTLSALLQAATKGLPNTVELLLRHGADHTVTTKKGDTALSILVEQNLIDAAVEMVTEYKASIPRCSRDRKKVQRARLLINLRIKQQKEGDYDDSDQDDSDEGARSALHDSANSPNSTTSTVSKKKKKKKKGMNAEQKAKAAEEALLLELEQEDVKAQKEEAAATSKRNKKKKKKERERQVKLEQEKVRREKEEKAIQERENQRKLKEENDRKLRAAKAKEQKELEMKEALERQKKAAARQKEKELKEKKRQQVLEQEKRDAEKKELLRREKEQETLLAQPKEEPTLQHADDPSKSKRGWETASGAESNSVKENTAQSEHANHSAKGTVEDQLENMANGVVGFLGFNPAMSKPAANSTPGSMMTEVSSETMDQPVPTMPQQAEPAPVSLLREEKVAELLQRTTAHLSSIDNSVVKTVLYKWIVRASSESMPFLDPVIPSWTDFDYLVSFLQRQLIAESRKASNGIANNIEMMKEAGSFLAKLCVSLAREVVEYRDKCSEVFPEMSDLNLKLNAHAVVINNGSNMVVVEWDARSKIFIPRALFEHLSDRYNGASTLLLNSMFALMKRYETMNYILGGTGLDYRLPQSTLSTVAKELKVEMELWTDPISVFGKNKFCGIFPDVDVLFGGLRPFIEQSSALEMLLAKEGGSVCVLSPSDDRTASFFMKRILNILEATDGKGVPVSFTVFLPMRAFRDLKQSPSAENLSFLDARLLQSHRHFIRHFETLNPGQHNFVHGSIDGQLNTCNTGSLMLILQNDSGRTQFPINEQSVANIVHSLSMTTFMPPVETFTSFGAESVPNSRGSSIPSSPVGLQHTLNGFEGMSNTNTNANTNNGSRRGRFVELVQDGEDDFANAEEMVSGMLSSLDISMFQENPSQDVDIEAISLMGIGNPDLVNPRRKTSGRFG
jgi:ankyrin repeat protein